jgi:septal ring factor EnvC (AmiA/AmiB activator)
MNESLQSLEIIQQKIGLVQQKIEQQKIEIATAKAENEKLIEQLINLEEEKKQSVIAVADMEAQLQNLRLAKSLSDEDEVKKSELKKMISNMIKEVDKCLAVVNTDQA